jgi:hypothetical protein
MSRYDYEASRQLAGKDWPFYALVMTLYRQADSENARKIEHVWPDVVAELQARYHAPGGMLDGES